MSKKSKAKKKEQRKLTFHQELKRTGCQSNQELKALKARREERTASKSRQIRHNRREIVVWLRAYEPMVYQLIGLGAQPQQEVEAGGFGESSEIDWASIESELIGTTTSGTTSQLEQVKEKEVGTPIGAAENEIQERTLHNYVKDRLYFMQPISSIPKRKYKNEDISKMPKDDPRNPVYYERPNSSWTRMFMISPEDQKRFVEVLYFILIPLENTAEEWRKIQLSIQDEMNE